MNKLNLNKQTHDKKAGMSVDQLKPNVTTDTIFMEDGKAIGFYIRDIAEHSKRLSDLIAIANNEFRSKNVPKQIMNRSDTVKGVKELGMSYAEASKLGVQQYSTIIGSVPPRPHMRRPYPSRSSVHGVPSAKIFIKAMLQSAIESEKLIKQYLPEQYEIQKEIISTQIKKELRFGNLFTSSISNYNISADYHRDNANLKNCLNVIIVKKFRSIGGNTTVPDYGATVDSCDNSMLVYPAWRNLHGVTPIETKDKQGYRNSLVFYPLKAFNRF